MIMIGEILDPVDQFLGAAAETVFVAFADRLAVESGIVQHRLDLAGEISAVMSAICFR